VATTKANELGQIIDSIVPSSLGTAGQVLTVNSGATAATFADAGGGADLYSANESSPNAQPSATGSNAIAVGDSATASGSYGLALGAYSSASGSSTFSAQGGTASALSSTAIGSQSVASGTSSVALGYNADATGSNSAALGRDAQAITASRAVAIGKSKASGDTSFAAAIGNNSSYGATGSNSIAIGSSASASSSWSVGIGRNSSATGQYGVVLGGYACVSSANYGYAFGHRGKAGFIGKYAFGVYTSSEVGSSQGGYMVLARNTTDATPAAVCSDGGNSTAGNTNQVVLPNNSAIAFHGTIVARQQASSGTASAAWKIEGLIRREGSAGTTVLVNSATTVLDNTPSWGMTLSADTTNGALKIEVTGASATNIRWVATINTSEVTY